MAPCIWDSDTLDTELRGLPDAFDLVVGRWHRHGEAYYRERVDRLADKPECSLAELDDLAVAYERLGRRRDAVGVMQTKRDALALTPGKEHQYRYHANLGTFHAHAGRFDEALVELKRAVAINPEAHFGREHFQIELIEYVAAAKRQPRIWRTHSFLRHAGYDLSFYIGGHALEDPERCVLLRGDRELSWDDAYRAIGGMLRFGGLEGPELYRSLGELFLWRRHLNLAWYAFGVAIERGHPAADMLAASRREIERHWDEARPHNRTGHVNPTEADFRAARDNADLWLAAFQLAEAEAIAAGEDVRSDAALQALLARADREVPRLAGLAAPEPALSWRTLAQWSLVGGGLLLLAGVLWLRSRAR